MMNTQLSPTCRAWSGAQNQARPSTSLKSLAHTRPRFSHVSSPTADASPTPSHQQQQQQRPPTAAPRLPAPRSRALSRLIPPRHTPPTPHRTQQTLPSQASPRLSPPPLLVLDWRGAVAWTGAGIHAALGSIPLVGKHPTLT